MANNFPFRILESRQSCELNPNKIESAAEACANAEFLLQVLDDITESIFMSSEACPRTLRYLCVTYRVSKKKINKETASTRNWKLRSYVQYVLVLYRTWHLLSGLVSKDIIDRLF